MEPGSPGVGSVLPANEEERSIDGRCRSAALHDVSLHALNQIDAGFDGVLIERGRLLQSRLECLQLGLEFHCLRC
jgi:hypothetical protein